MVFFIFLSPIYLVNKIDFTVKRRKNPFYQSIIVRLINTYPLLFDLSLFILDFPNPINVFNIIPNFSGGTLQVGCGTGLLNLYCKKKNLTISENLDINIALLKYGYRKKRYISFTHANICDVPIKDNNYDNIIFARCFHHIHHHKKAFRECARLLKKNGHIIIADPIFFLRDKSTPPHMVNSSTDGLIWKFNMENLKDYIDKCLPSNLEIENVKFVRQPNVTNYNLKYPQIDALIIVNKIS